MGVKRVILLGAASLVLAACGGGGASSEVSLLGTDSLEFEPNEVTAPAGEVEFELTSEEGVEHTLVIEELDDEQVAAADAGETDSGQTELSAGSYTLYCDIEGHREAGMEATLTVED